MARQYVAVSFAENDTRTYTYHNDGDPVAVGDEVLIETKGREKRVVVKAINVVEPTKFQTKPIIGLAPPREKAEEANVS